ncbi:MULTISPECIES: carboxymuconolactone decarboxylase family protein [Chelativorans]|jgi:4-carboxymuconolactone decarboxylase|uniref:4-carboxymuconolactone decarboxylase n=1 Tax=Chelativorans sp. (strain BNC1) TaxID=266779 RepID=Q11E43_CHESB|nr:MULTISPECIES: carboxymuconolactone decarboxylase family protein [Chelativorans]
MPSQKYETGMRRRRQILGDAYVDAALKASTDLTAPFQELVAEYVWGTIWSREGLDERTRNLINVALMVAMNRPHELQLYIKARHQTGAKLEEISETILQTAVYCGVPAALEAFKEFNAVVESEKAS